MNSTSSFFCSLGRCRFILYDWIRTYRCAYSEWWCCPVDGIPSQAGLTAVAVSLLTTQYLVLNDIHDAEKKVSSFLPLLLPLLIPSRLLVKPTLDQRISPNSIDQPKPIRPQVYPPYHRVTTTTTSQTSINCIKCSNLPPAAVSPSSSLS